MSYRLSSPLISHRASWAIKTKRARVIYKFSDSKLDWLHVLKCFISRYICHVRKRIAASWNYFCYVVRTRYSSRTYEILSRSNDILSRTYEILSRYYEIVCRTNDIQSALVTTALLCFDYGLTAGVTGQQRMLTPPWHLILPSLLSKVRVALHSILYVFFGLWLRLILCYFAIYHCTNCRLVW